jgi:hypothetical protein
MRSPRPRPPAAPVGPVALVAEKLFGVRWWQIRCDDRGRLRLHGCFGGSPWLAEGKSTWAVCGGFNPRSRHEAPFGPCTCGLYALHPWAISGSSHWCTPGPEEELIAAGVIEAWGRVHVHGEGFRAQYARPVALARIGFPPDSPYGSLIAKLAGPHRAEVVHVRDAAGLTELCAERGLGLDPHAVRALLRPPKRN